MIVNRQGYIGNDIVSHGKGVRLKPFPLTAVLMPLLCGKGHFRFILLPVGSESSASGSPVPMWAISPWKKDIPTLLRNSWKIKRGLP